MQGKNCNFDTKMSLIFQGDFSVRRYIVGINQETIDDWHMQVWDRKFQRWMSDNDIMQLSVEDCLETFGH